MFNFKARRAAAVKAANQARALRMVRQAHYWTACAARCIEGGASRRAYLADARRYIADARVLFAA